MKILGLLNSPWMIDQGTLSEITREYVNHMKGEKLDFKALLSEQDRARPRFEVQNRVAIIQIHGVLTPGMSFFSFFFDEASTKNIQNNIQAALDDPEIDRIVVDMDTPGGAVKGTFELADYIFESAKQKDIQTYSAGTIASGGMIIAAATNKITISGKTNQVGSIGVIARKLDFSKQNEMIGLEVEEFVTGRFKNTGSPDKKTTDEDREEIQAQVNSIFVPMVEDISSRRGLDPQAVIDMEGRVYIGKDAIKNGLVDGVSTLEELINSTAGALNFNATNKQVNMNKDEFKANHPELFNELTEDAYKRGADGVSNDVKAQAATNERERIAGINTAMFKGQEILAAEMIADGKTSPGEAAIRFNAAEKQTREDAGAAAAAAMPEPVPTSEPTVKEPEAKKEEEKPETPEQKFDASDELKAEFGDLETYNAYLDATKAGQVNVFQGEGKE